MMQNVSCLCLTSPFRFHMSGKEDSCSTEEKCQEDLLLQPLVWGNRMYFSGKLIDKRHDPAMRARSILSRLRLLWYDSCYQTDELLVLLSKL